MAVVAPASATLKVRRIEPLSTNVPANVSSVVPVVDVVDSEVEVGPGGRKHPAANANAAIPNA